MTTTIRHCSVQVAAITHTPSRLSPSSRRANGRPPESPVCPCAQPPCFDRKTLVLILYQRMEGPSIGESTSNASGSKKSIKIDVTLNDVQSLWEISQQMSEKARSNFNNKYGRILDLLRIPVDAPALSAFAQYWNSTLRCFELPDLDVTPTIEEYAYMLRLPIQKESRVYLYYGQYVADGKIASLLELKPEQLDKVEKGNTTGLKRRFLEGYLRELAQQQRWVLFNRLLALLIYGLVLFPFIPDVIDRSAMDVFYRVEEYGVNLVPAILAETFLSLQVCHQNQQGKLRCCAPMLYVWIMTHLYAGNKIDRTDDPLKGFIRMPLKSRKLYEWKQEFDQVDSRSFRWMCPWYNGDSVIFSCGGFSNVPLMGPRGCVSYSPALVMCQLRWTQDEPPKELLGGAYFLYQECESIKSQTMAIRSAWNNIHIKGRDELGRRIIARTKRYEAWREARRGCPSKPEPPPSAENNPLTEDQMLEKIEILKAQMGVLDEKNQVAEVTIVKLQSQVQKLNLQIENLRSECADSYEAPSRMKRARKEKEAVIQELQAKVECQENTLVRILKKKEELEWDVGIHVETIQILKERVGSLQESLAQTELYSDRGWNEAARYRQLLTEANERENWLRTKMQENERGEAQRHAEWVKGWKLVVRDVIYEREAWRRKYEDMIGRIQYHTSQLVDRFEEVSIQVYKNPFLQIPPEVTEFFKHFGKLAKGFRKKKMKLLA